MTFAAMAGWAGWLLLAGAGAVAAALFLIKLRPPRILVPSLALWQRVLDASPGLTRWERIRRAVSLVLTIAIAMLLALAVARPARRGTAAAGSRGRALIVLDSSWSMRARTGGGPTRWDSAIREARRLARSSDTVALATTADGLIEGPTDDVALIDAALGSLPPPAAGGGAWPALPDMDAVHFITDGAVTRILDPAIVVHSVFEAAANVAITAFDVRPALGATSGGASAIVADAYLEIANFARMPQPVRVTIERGSVTIADRRIDLAAGEAYRQVIPLPRQGDPALHARVEAPDDALDVDDDGYAWIRCARPLSIVVVSDRPEWLRRLLSADASLRPTFVAPDRYRPRGEAVAIFDRWAPAAPGSAPALYFAPPAETPWLRDGAGAAAGERRPRWDTAGAHEVLRGVDPRTLRIERALGYSPARLEPLAWSAAGTPLVYAGADGPARTVVVAFGPQDSNLPFAPMFPVLVANALDWLGDPGARDLALGPGLAAFDPAVRRVIDPGGRPVALLPMDDATVATLRSPGFYVAEIAGARSTFAVNMADPQRSDLARSRLGREARPALAAAPLDRPWWLIFALAAFALILAEWWTWQRRVTV